MEKRCNHCGLLCFFVVLFYALSLACRDARADPALPGWLHAHDVRVCFFSWSFLCWRCSRLCFFMLLVYVMCWLVRVFQRMQFLIQFRIGLCIGDFSQLLCSHLFQYGVNAWLLVCVGVVLEINYAENRSQCTRGTYAHMWYLWTALGAKLDTQTNKTDDTKKRNTHARANPRYADLVSISINRYYTVSLVAATHTRHDGVRNALAHHARVGNSLVDKNAANCATKECCVKGGGGGGLRVEMRAEQCM